MLTRARWSGGFTLIELMVTVTILALLVFAALPSFLSWIQSTQIRNSAESILNALVLAKTEAVRQNTAVSFQLVTSLTAACAVSTSGVNWVVSRDDPTSKCDVTASDTTAPRTVGKRSANEGSSGAVVAASQAAVTFNGLGQATNLAASPSSINVTNPSGGTCASAGGKMRCLRVDVTAAGQIRMCDPALASTDPRAC